MSASAQQSETPTVKKGWNLDAPSYVPLQTPSAGQTPSNAKSRGVRGRGQGHRGRGGRNSHYTTPPTGRQKYNNWHPAHAYGAVYYGEGGVMEYGSPDPRAYHTDAVYLVGGESSAQMNPEQENFLFEYPSSDGYSQLSYQSQDFRDFPGPDEADLDAENAESRSVAGSVAASSNYTDANSSFMESLITQSSRGSYKASRRNRNQRISVDTSLKPELNVSTDERRMEQRQKQIDYGKNTIGYQRYIQIIPKDKRRRGDPETPKKETKCSKRCWDGLIRHWRRKLHEWDPPEMKGQETSEWELPSMSDTHAESKTKLEDQSTNQPQLARDLFGQHTESDDPPSWAASFSINELDQKFARKLRPFETFSGFGPSPTKRDQDYTWSDFSIDQLDKKFGHKLFLSEPVELDWGSTFSNPITAALPFTPSPRSKLFPSPLSTGRTLPITPIRKLDPAAPTFDLGTTPMSEQASVPPIDRTPGSNRPSSISEQQRRIRSTPLDDHGSPRSMYDEDDSIMVIFDPTATSSVPSLASSAMQSRVVSRNPTPPRASFSREGTPQSIWANPSPARSSPGARIEVKSSPGASGMVLDGVW